MIKLGQAYRQGLESQLKRSLENKDSIFVLRYSGASSAVMSELRKELRRLGARLIVSRNSVSKRTLKNIKLEKIEEFINGPIAFVYGDSDAVVISKALMKFVKEHETAQLQGGLLKETLLNPEDIKRLSVLPSREVLLSMLLSAIQSPISSLAYVLSAKTRELLFVLKQIADKKK